MKKNKSLIQIIQSLVIPIILILLLLKFVWYLSSNKEDNIKQRAAFTTGTVSGIVHKKIKCYAVIYIVHNDKYECIQSTPATDIEIGSKYKVMYNIDSPKDAIVLFQEPSFDNYENIDSAIAVIKDISMDNCILYSYSVGTQVFNRYQMFYDISNLKIGQSIKCYYLIDNQSISILDNQNYKNK